MATFEELRGDIDRAVKSFSEKTEEMKTLVKERDEALEEKYGELPAVAGKMSEVEQTMLSLEEEIKGMRSALDELEAEGSRPGQRHEIRSLGREVIESEEFQSYKTDRFSGKSKPVNLKGLGLERKAGTISSGTTGYGGLGGLIEPQEQGVLAPIQLPLMLRDLFPVIPTTSDTVTFIEVLDHANVYTELDAQKLANATSITVKSTAGLYVGQTIYIGTAADPTAQTAGLTITAINTGTRVLTVAANTAPQREVGDPLTSKSIGMTPAGSQKPQASLLGTVERSYSIGTMAHYMVAHRQTLQDIPQLEGVINNALLFGLKQSEEEQLLYGNGTAPNLTGLMNNANIGNQANWSAGTDGSIAGGVWRFKHARKAIAAVQNAGGVPNGFLVHPDDWVEIELAQDTTNQFMWAVVPGGVNAAEVLWRVPVVVTQAIAKGQFLVGDFQNGSYILDREDANVRMSDSHADYFTANMVAILAEERIGVATPRPKFFQKGTWTTVA